MNATGNHGKLVKRNETRNPPILDLQFTSARLPRGTNNARRWELSVRMGLSHVVSTVRLTRQDDLSGTVILDKFPDSLTDFIGQFICLSGCHKNSLSTFYR